MLLTISDSAFDEENSVADANSERVATEGSRTLVSLAERVAVVETKVGSLKEDTGVIRAAIHDINNRMTEFVAAELRCVDALNTLLGMKTDLNMLMSANQQGKGVWRAMAIVGTALMGAVTMGAAISSALWWLLHGH